MSKKNTDVSMFEAIKERIRPLIRSQFAKSQQAAQRASELSSLSAKETRIFLAGFELGWFEGASAVAEINLLESDLDPLQKNQDPH